MKTQTIIESQAAVARPKGAQITRDRFTTHLGVIAATLGAAVGLGNIWRFPFLTGVNGGATFIVVYLLCTMLIGLPIMIAELVLGRRARANTVTALIRLAPKRQPWWLIGAAGVLTAFLFLAFYTEVAAWVFAYIFKAASGAILSTDPQHTSQAFTQLVTDPVQSLLWQWFILLFVGSIIIFGVSRGIERITRWLMPVLFLLLIVVCVRSLTLPGAGQGLAFLFRPDLSKISGAMVLTAMGLAFFKLSIGMGAMITYGSYFRDDQNIPLTAIRVMLADLAVSILAGIAIFPAVFAFGFKPDAGPSLLFITIPAVFASMPFGYVCVVLFFLLAAIAATGAMLSLIEVPVSFLSERFGLGRARATALTLVPIALLGATAALSNSLLADVTLFGKTMFDLYDFLTSNVLLPLGGLFIAIFVGWVWGFDQIRQALSNDGAIQNQRTVQAFYGVVKLITPVLVVIVLLNGLKLL
jgi:NSS family neurotransmitter:Na+ symporter